MNDKNVAARVARGTTMPRHANLAGLLACIFVVAGFLYGSECAQAQTTTPSGDCWFNSATGKPAITVPAGVPGGFIEHRAAYESGSASGAGQNYFRDPSGAWINSRTGKPAITVPAGVPGGFIEHRAAYERGSASGAGQNYFRGPCPPPSGAASVPALPVLPFGLNFGFGRQDRGDDPYRK